MFGEKFKNKVPLVKPTPNNGMTIKSLFLKGVAKHFTFIFLIFIRVYTKILVYYYFFSNKAITNIIYYGEKIDGCVYNSSIETTSTNPNTTRTRKQI